MDTICNELADIDGNTIYWFRGSYKIIFEEYTKFTATATENVAPCNRYCKSIKYSSKMHTLPA